MRVYRLAAIQVTNFDRENYRYRYRFRHRQDR